MVRRIVIPLAATAALAGCVTPSGPRGPEFVDRVLHLEAANGQASTLFLHPDGAVEARYGGKTTAGRWDFRRGMLCYTWNGTYRECWPHTAPFVPGRTETIHSDRGNVIRVTME